MGDALGGMESGGQTFRGDRGEIRLSTVSTFASHWLIPRLPQFQARHPGLEVAIFTTTRAVDFKKESIDCAIRHGRGTWKGLASTLLFKETLMPIAAPAVADRVFATTRPALRAAPLIRAPSLFPASPKCQKTTP